MKRVLITTAVVAGLLSSLSAVAQFQKPEDAVEYRQSVMTVMATHFGRLGAMVQGKLPFDAAAANMNAEVAGMMSKLPFDAFIDGTAGKEKGTAKSTIWTERPKFDEDAKTMQEAMVKLVAAAKTNDLAQIKAAFGPVGKSCKSCHDDFRNK